MAIMCFAEADRQRPGRYTEIVRRADRFIKGIQNDEGEGHDPSSPAHGGAGYGKHKRPDLSNTGIMIDALIAAGNGPDDEALKKALIFVSRCQNLETEHNDTKWSVKNADGSWINKHSRWMEADPNLVSGYALLALSYCREPKKK